MLRHSRIVLALALAACASSDVTLKPTLPPPEAPPAPEQAPAKEAPAPAPKKIDSSPDVPRGATARRDGELAKQAAGVVGAYANGDPRLSPDGKRLYFLSDRDGISTLYAADAADPAAPATRLVAREERISSFELTRDGKAILFRSDTGGDDNWSLFRVGLDGKDLVELTAGEKKNQGVPIEPEGAPGRIFYTVRDRSAATTELRELSLAGGAPRTIATLPTAATLLDVSRDGKTLAVNRVAAITETTLDLVDVAGGKARQIYPKQGDKVLVAGARFSADGARLLVASDGGGDKALLLGVSRTGVIGGRREETGSWSPQERSCVMTRKGDRLACQILTGEHNVLRIYDARTLKPLAAPEAPLGSGNASAFSDDGARLLFSWSMPSHPRDLFAFDGKTTVALRQDPRPGLEEMPALEGGIVEIKAHDGLTLHLNVYLPPAAKEGKKLPVIVSFHGGPASLSPIRWTPTIRHFTSLGYAFVEPNVRGSIGFGRAFEMADNLDKRADAVRDIETVGRWAAAQSWADKDRLVAMGQGFGGTMVLYALTRTPDLWRAGVDLQGPSDLVSCLLSTTGTAREVLKHELGDVEKDRALLESLSPLRDVAKISDPLFVMNGANNVLAPRSETDQLVLALRQRGVPVEYMVADNEGSTLAHRENVIAVLARSSRFLEDALH